MINKEITCFFTGHRVIPAIEYDTVKEKLKNEIISLIEKKGVKYFIAGGALGFDTLAAWTVLKLKEDYDIRLILYLPCKDQWVKWNKKDIALYKEIIALSDQHYYISYEYTKDCMLKRNRKMVEAGKYCISYLRRNTGGTAYTVNYSKQSGTEIISI